jgi:hypothetical protein
LFSVESWIWNQFILDLKKMWREEWILKYHKVFFVQESQNNIWIKKMTEQLLLILINLKL